MVSDSEKWAVAVWVADRLRRGPRAGVRMDDARLIAERSLGSLMLYAGPTESFSEKMPAYSPAAEEEGLAPIDVLYGRYDADHLLVEIFINRIRADAPRFRCEVSDLLTVVRLHEYAHAIVHTGVDAACVDDQLQTFGPGGTTDWDSFRTRRDEAFFALDSVSHELLAQAMSWACLCQESAQQQFQSLIETFLALEAHQPQRYRLPPRVKLRARWANWPLILEAARRQVDVYQGPAFSLADGLAALIEQSAEPTGMTDLPESDPLVPVVAELQRRLADVDLACQKSHPDDEYLKLLILRKGHTELRMYKETAHRRPHFHVEYKREFEASYALDLDSFERLAGFMPRKYEDAILPVARASRDRLIEKWRSLNGTVRIALAEGPA